MYFGYMVWWVNNRKNEGRVILMNFHHVPNLHVWELQEVSINLACILIGIMPLFAKMKVIHPQHQGCLLLCISVEFCCVGRDTASTVYFCLLLLGPGIRI